MRKLIWTLVIVAVIAIFGGRAWWLYKQSVAEKDVVKIGAIFALTGKSAYLGEETRAGLEVAASILRNRGKNIKIIYEDSSLDPKKGLSAFKKITSDKDVKALIVAHTMIAAPIVTYLNNLPQEQQEKYPLIISILAFSINNKGSTSIRFFPNASNIGRLMGKYIVKNHTSYKKMAVLYQNDDYGKDAAKAFMYVYEGNGGKVVYKDTYNVDMSLLRNLALKTLETKPDAIYMNGATPELSYLIKQIRTYNPTIPIFAETGMDDASIRQSIGDVAIKGITFSSVFSDSSELEKNKEYKQYKELLAKLGKKPDFLNIYTAMALLTFYDVLEKNPSGSSSNLATHFQSTSYDTLLGKIDFDDNRGASVPVFIKQTVSLDPSEDRLLEIIN